MTIGVPELVLVFLLVFFFLLPLAAIAWVIYLAVKKGTQAGQQTLPPPGTPPA